MPLKDWLTSNNAAMGKELEGYSVSSGDLPFLFKVLSIAKGLSIQAHPNRELAQKLHAERPEVYKYPNHKPQIACALTPFEALCQFRSASKIC